MAWLKEEEGGPGESEPKAALKDKVGDQEESTNQQVRREPGLRRHGKLDYLGIKGTQQDSKCRAAPRGGG